MTTVDLPDTLQSEVSSPGIDPAAIGRLTRIFHRTLAERLAGRLYGEPARASRVTRLTPRSVWLSAAAAPDRALTAEEIAWFERDLAGGFGPPTQPVVVDASNADDWHRQAVEVLQRNVQDVNDESRLTLGSTSRGSNVARVLEALRALVEVWPEAAVECHLLIRSVVLLDNTELTASQDQMFGVLFAGTEHLESVPRTVEVLLHETGHHSLFVRLAFAQFVHNPDDVVQHPLRTDPRPISGTVHAGHVLYRMTEGLRRLAERGDPEAVRRRDAALTKLLATVDVLRANAQWTGVGADWFSSLQARARSLSAAASA